MAGLIEAIAVAVFGWVGVAAVFGWRGARGRLDRVSLMCDVIMAAVMLLYLAPAATAVSLLSLPPLVMVLSWRLAELMRALHARPCRGPAAVRGFAHVAMAAAMALMALIVLLSSGSVTTGEIAEYHAHGAGGPIHGLPLALRFAVLFVLGGGASAATLVVVRLRRRDAGARDAARDQSENASLLRCAAESVAMTAVMRAVVWG